jgi:hypothetical protein
MLSLYLGSGFISITAAVPVCLVQVHKEQDPGLGATEVKLYCM